MYGNKMRHRFHSMPQLYYSTVFCSVMPKITAAVPRARIFGAEIFACVLVAVQGYGRVANGNRTENIKSGKPQVFVLIINCTYLKRGTDFTLCLNSIIQLFSVRLCPKSPPERGSLREKFRLAPEAVQGYGER